MFNTLRWFIGITLILIHLKGYFLPSECHECRPKLINIDSLYIDCIDRNLTKIPQDLGENLEVLNISNNPLTELNEGDLQNYADLTELVMKDLRITKISDNFFAPVRELFVLDISSSCFNSFPKLPNSLKRILTNSIMSNTNCPKASLPTVSNLEFLVEFESRQNKLIDLPVLSPLAPIQFIDLSKNSMKNLKYTDIAPFCVLSQLNLFGTDLVTKEYLQQCCGLKKWGEKFEILIHLECSSSCQSIDFDTKAVDQYTECTHTPASSYFPFEYYLMNYIVVVIVILSMSYLIYRFYKSEAATQYRARKAQQRLKQLEQEPEEQEEGINPSEGNVLKQTSPFGSLTSSARNFSSINVV